VTDEVANLRQQLSLKDKKWRFGTLETCAMYKYRFSVVVHSATD